MGKLTVKKVEALSAPGRYSDDDGSGFHLRIDAEGRKYWVLRVHDAAGKRRDVSLGSVRRLSLSAAREKAREARERLETIGTPKVAPTFAEAAALAHRSRTAGYSNAKHVAQWLSTLRTYVEPLIGERPVNQVTRADVVAVLSSIWLEKPETARRVLQRIDRVMRWAVGNDHRDDRIDMNLVRDALPKQPRKRASVRRMPAVAVEEAPAFFNDVATSASDPTTRLGLKMLMLTAVRPGNIAAAKRDQFDLSVAVWTIPAEEMKAKEAHRVPLAPAAVAIVEAAMKLHDHDLLFSRYGAAISPDTLRMSMRRMGRSETPHGFRSTFKEWARAEGWADHLSEAALAHQDRNEVRAAYARSDQLEARRPMMLAWASYLEGERRSPAAPPSGLASADPS